MRVLFYLLDGDTNASSHHRALQFFPLLRAHGLRPSASRPVPAPLYDRLVERGRAGLAARGAYYGLFLARRLRDVLRAADHDVVVVQRDLFPFGPPALERLLRRRNPRLVYDTDDATYLRPSFTPDSPFQRWRRFDKVDEVVRAARWVSVATEPIAAWARRRNPRVSVLPMAVDLAAYDAARRPPRAGSPVVLGWAGTAGGLRYLEALAPVLRDLARERPILVRVISGGYRQVSLPGVPLDARPWRPDSHLADLSTFDVGLVPLADSEFERAKFPFKLLQYLALGVPPVCARVGLAASLLDDGRSGLLAGEPAEWRAHLDRAVADLDLRRRLSAAGRDVVADRFTVERVGPRLAEGLRAVARS